ncbi:mannose-1-phosphate guanylyltransferase/mannose-6-phosphate isomerase [Sphingorhabdus arenilitoris]|uniref:Mannose-1-phosphate guanylyltransferase/mannose-6-phosphate isomerase n=1 Tax=Sphingorhabdus arenilitoris TaxID=1490041 RepID=A0ABV8RH43_9SPHN
MEQNPGTKKITPVILSGGGGTRLWPMSRPERPKQFLALTGPHTMFQMTLDRCCDAAKFAPPLIVAGTSHIGLIGAQLEQIGVSDAEILLEPCARNTAPAIALAALAAADPDAPLLVMPSDHVIEDVAAFHAAIDAALPLVGAGWLTTFGITPTRPETGYGYIQTGEPLSPGVHKVARFTEKPDAVRAAEMIAGGDHLWNGGIFLFCASAYLEALGQFAPAMLSSATAAMEKAKRSGNQIHADKAAFETCPADSIDYAVMEKAEKVAVIPVSMGWSDVGSWDALYDLGNHPLQEYVTDLDGKGNLIHSDGIRIHAAGLEDMIIVASGNDVLIVPRGKSQSVKQIVEGLKQP